MKSTPQEIQATDRRIAGNKTSDPFTWRPILIYYCVYTAVVFVGDLLHYHANTIGACLFLLLLCCTYWRHLPAIRIDGLFFSMMFAGLIPMVPIAFYDDRIFAATYNELVKYYSLIVLILIGSALPIRPIAEQKDRYAEVLQILLLLYLLAGWLWPGGNGVVMGRVKGFLPNPNGFALTAMMLLFLIRDSSGKLREYLTHGIVISLIYVSHTSGAIIGYAAGLFYSLTYWNKARNMPLRISGVLIVVSLMANIFLSLPPKTFKPVDLIVKKIAVVKENWRAIAENKPVSYYDMVSREGEDVTSGMWRLKHWTRILKTFLHGDLFNVAFGNGIGTTDLIFKLKSHNDYLRILFETGILGFVSNVCLWLILFRRMDKAHRWVAVMVAVYCMTENNYDHFPAMSLLSLYMLSFRRQPAEFGNEGRTPGRTNSDSTGSGIIFPTPGAGTFEGRF